MKNGVQDVQKRTQASLAVQSRTRAAQFFSLKINACENRKEICRRENVVHQRVIYKSIKRLHRTAAYPAVPHDLTQNDEADRVLL